MSHPEPGARSTLANLPVWAGALAVTLALLSVASTPAEAAARLQPTSLEAGAHSVANRHAPAARPVRGELKTSVANIPNRTSAAAFTSSIRKLTKHGSDFVMLNEVGRRSIDGIRAAAPGYDAYRDPTPDRSTGGSQSMNNVVMWRTDRWRLVDAGRVKLVDDDKGYQRGRAFTWDRYATWATLRRTDGAKVSVVSTHLPTNPAKFPRQHGNPSMSRVEQYAHGMDLLVRLVRTLSARGQVLVGGDMNSHLSQGSWTAAAKMTSAGFKYAKDRGVMYLFYKRRAELIRSRQVKIASDHPGLITKLDLSARS